MAHVTALTAIGPRPGDSDASRLAAGYIAAQLADLGIAVERLPVGDVELPRITVLGVTYREAHHIVTTDPDLVVRFGPPGRALLVTAHYDTVPSSPGAVDNAAAVGVLLELARVFHDHPPSQPVVLAFTANEELGLVGAEALARDRGPEIDFAIALDLIGGSGELSINGASNLIGFSELRWLANAADRAGIVLAAPLPHRVVSRWWPQAERADHGAFTRRGIRAVHLYNRGQDGESIDLAYHSAADVLARVHPTALDVIGRLLRALVAMPPPRHDGDGFWLPLARNTVIPRWSVVAIEIALALLALVALLTTRDGGVAGRGAGLIAGIACYAAAVAVAVAVERVAPGHPAAWIHDPLRWTIAEALVIAGAFGLATRAVGRFARWIGVRRYLAVAVIVPLAIGVALIAVGAAELAWIWLIPAALIAIAPRWRFLAIPAVLAQLLPLTLVLAPAQLREAAWNGFLPLTLPLAVWIGALGISVAATGVWWVRNRGRTGTLGTLVLTLGCGLAVVIGMLVALTSVPPCTTNNFNEFGLRCERR